MFRKLVKLPRTAFGWFLRGVFIFLWLYHLERLLHVSVYAALPEQLENVRRIFATSLLLQFGLSLSVFRPARWLSALCLVSCIVCWNLFPGIYYGADQMTFNLLLFAAFFSEDSWENPDYVSVSGIALMFSHLIVIYVMNGCSKLGESQWLDGTVISNFVLPQFGFIGNWIRSEVSWVAKPSGFLVIGLQFSIIGILFQRSRKYTALCFIVFHLMISISLHFLFGIACALIHCIVFQYQRNFFEDAKRILFNRSDEGTRFSSSLEVSSDPVDGDGG